MLQLARFGRLDDGGGPAYCFAVRSDIQLDCKSMTPVSYLPVFTVAQTTVDLARTWDLPVSPPVAPPSGVVVVAGPYPPVVAVHH